MDWTLATIRSYVRELTGRPSTNQIADATVNSYINDFYRETLPRKIVLPELDTWFVRDTVDGEGEYPLDEVGSPNLLLLKLPITIDGTPITLHTDQNYFFGQLYPEDTTVAEAQPTDALFYGRVLYLRPVPDAVYEIKAAAVKLPTILSQDTDQPIRNIWGRLIAVGTAIDIRTRNDEDLGHLPKLWTEAMNDIRREKVNQLFEIGARAVPKW